MSLGDDTMPLLSEQELRTHNVRIYRPHTTTRKPAFDWDALTPTCKGCGQKSGQLNADSVCPTCRTPELPKEEKPGKPTPRRSAPRQESASSNPRGARGAGPSTTRKNRPARRETRPARVGRPPRTYDVDAIAEAYRGGQSAQSIADALGMGRNKVRAILRDAGVEFRPHAGQRTGGHRGGAVDEPAIVEAYKAGDSAPQLAEEHDTTPTRVRRILRRHGVELRDDRSNNRSKPKQYDPDLCLAVERLYVQERLSQTEVAEQLGISRKVVENIMHRRGVRARQGESGRSDGAVQLREHIERLDVLPRTIKLWALQAGLVDRITPGYPSQALVDAYEAAHGGGQ